MTNKFKLYLIYCIIQLVLKGGECYCEVQTLNSFDGALSHVYSGFSLEIEDSLAIYL